MQVISDTTISKGLVAFRFPLIIFGNLIFSFPAIFLPLFVLERIPANLQHLCAKLSENTQPVLLLTTIKTGNTKQKQDDGGYKIDTGKLFEENIRL